MARSYSRLRKGEDREFHTEFTEYTEIGKSKRVLLLRVLRELRVNFLSDRDPGRNSRPSR